MSYPGLTARQRDSSDSSDSSDSARAQISLYLSISEASISLPHTQMPSLYPRNPQPSQVQVNCMTLPCSCHAWLVGRTGLTPPFVQIVSNPPNSCHTLRYRPKGYVVRRGASSVSVGAHMPVTPSGRCTTSWMWVEWSHRCSRSALEVVVMAP